MIIVITINIIKHWSKSDLLFLFIFIPVALLEQIINNSNNNNYDNGTESLKGSKEVSITTIIKRLEYAIDNQFLKTIQNVQTNNNNNNNNNNNKRDYHNKKKKFVFWPQLPLKLQWQ